MERFLEPVFTKKITNDNKDNKNKKTFTIEKLERGFGQTMGTSMRRTLLSSIPSVAPFAIELKGVSHQFQPIKDAQEDVVELINNLKSLVLKGDTTIVQPDEILELKLISNNGVVTAKDFETPAGVEVINKDLIIANTSKDKALNFKVYISFSKGYKTFEENRPFIENNIGTVKNIIPMDSNFSPIKLVNYSIEEVNPGESKVYERLILEVETKGNMEPEKAVAIAGAILKNHYLSFEDLSVLDETLSSDLFEEEKIIEEDNLKLSIIIEELNLSVRSQNGLEKANIKTIGELINRPFSDLKKIENLGDKSVSEIVEVIQNLGLAFKTE